jgi:hypothetical protein
VRFAFIAADKAAFPVRLLCRTLQVSRAGFYARDRLQHEPPRRLHHGLPSRRIGLTRSGDKWQDCHTMLAQVPGRAPAGPAGRQGAERAPGADATPSRSPSNE